MKNYQKKYQIPYKDVRVGRWRKREGKKRGGRRENKEGEERIRRKRGGKRENKYIFVCVMVNVV